MVEKLYNFGSSLLNSCFSTSGEKIKPTKVQRKQKLKATWWIFHKNNMVKRFKVLWVFKVSLVKKLFIKKKHVTYFSMLSSC
jgi:hypothetical protein